MHHKITTHVTVHEQSHSKRKLAEIGGKINSQASELAINAAKISFFRAT